VYFDRRPGPAPGCLLMRFDPPARPACRHGRAHLQPPDCAAVLAPHPEPQSQRSLALGGRLSERQHAPGVAARAVGRDLVALLMQSSDAPETNHGVKPSGLQAHGVSLNLSIR